MSAEDEIRAADQEWARAFAAGDLEKSLAFCAEDCAVLVANGPSVRGREAIRELFAGWFEPELKISWTPDTIEVANSGDLGFSSGNYQMTFKDASGTSVDDRGKYLIVWRKQADGSWKVLRDISNSDLPA